MITSKQRSYLKKLAHDLETTVYLGKSGISDGVKKEIEIALSQRELLKVKLQEGCQLDTKDIANQLAREFSAEFVQAIGRRFTLYREGKDNYKVIQLPK